MKKQIIRFILAIIMGAVYAGLCITLAPTYWITFIVIGIVISLFGGDIEI